jgi:hypothetical protein
VKLDFNFRRFSSLGVKKQLENSKELKNSNPLGESESLPGELLNFSQLLVVYSAVFDYFGGCFSLPPFPEFFIQMSSVFKFGKVLMVLGNGGTFESYF